MTIELKFNMGDRVPVEVDGGFEHAVIKSANVHIPEDFAEHFNIKTLYRVIAEWKEPRTDPVKGDYLTPMSQTLFVDEQELISNFKLYKRCSEALTPEQASLPVGKRERLILWNMMVAKHNPRREKPAKQTALNQQPKITLEG